MKAVVIAAILFGSFCLSVRAEDSNPYASIVARNMFSLVPMPTNNPDDDKKPDPPAKITPNGIMTLFGQLQVLFKVATPPKPGEPAQDQSYVMSEGDRQDGIAVTKIDEQAGMITFDNHGVTQKLALTTATSASTAAGGNPRGGMPGMRHFNGRLGQPRNPNNPFGGNNPTAYSPANGNNSGANPMSNSTTPSYGGGYGGNNAQSASPLSPEAQALLIENNYIQAKTSGDSSASLFPPTPLRGQSDASLNGAPAP